MLRTNVCVVGAGPAGTVASLFLSKNEVPHILVDRAMFPREKVCGEFFDGRLQRILNKIEPNFMQNMKEKNIIQDIRRYTYFNTKLEQLTVDTPLNMTARVSANRYDFDNYLLEEALKSKYVQYFDNTNISTGKVTATGVSLSNSTKSFEVEAQTAILATGSNSPLSQKIVPKNRAIGHFLLAARGYYRNIAKPDQQNVAQVYFFRQPFPYYLCLVHLPNNLATAEVCMLKTIAAKHRVNPESLLLNIVREHAEIKKIFTDATLEGKIKGASLPRASGKQAISAERILLAGSCSSIINPVTGWGVGHAAFEAMLAVNQYVASAQMNDFSAKAFREYDKKIHGALGKERLIGRLADWALMHGSSPVDWMIGCIASNAWLSRKASALINSV